MEINTRFEHGKRIPCVKVKCYSAPAFDAERIAKHNGISLKRAEAFSERCYQNSQEEFWESAQTLAVECFGDKAKVFSDGRSAGWLIVTGIGEPEYWDDDCTLDGDKMREHWGEFEAAILADIAERKTAYDYVDEECAYYVGEALIKAQDEQIESSGAELLAACKLALDFIHTLPYSPSNTAATMAQDALVDAISSAETKVNL